MSSYSRMIVIPQEEYAQMSAMQQAKQPLANQLYRREQDYQQNLQISDPYRAVLLQSETIEELKDLKKKMRDAISLATPLASRSRAIALFNSIEPHLNVNDRGEIITYDKEIIDSSRYEDLIQHATRRMRRTDYIPSGWDYFLTLLKKYNVPKFALNKETLKEMTSNTKPVTLPNLKTVKPSKLPIPKQWIKKSPTSSPDTSSFKQMRGRTKQRNSFPRKASTRTKAPPKYYTSINMNKLCCLPCNDPPEINVVVTCTCCGSSHKDLRGQCNHEHEVDVKRKSCKSLCCKCRNSKKQKKDEPINE